MNAIDNLPKYARIALFCCFSFYQVWVFTFFFDNHLYAQGGDDPFINTYVRNGSVLLLSAFLLCMGALPRITKVLCSRIGYVCAVIALEACTPLALYASTSSTTGMAFALLIIVLSAFGTSLLGIGWAETLRNMKIEEIAAGIILALATNALLHFSAMNSITVLLLILIVAPVASFACAIPFLSSSQHNSGSDNAWDCVGEASGEDAPQNKASLKKHLASYSACWFFVGASLGTMSVISELSKPTSTFPWIALFSLLLMASLVIVMFLSNHGKKSLARIEKVVVALLGVFILSEVLLSFLPVFSSPSMNYLHGFFALTNISLVEILSLTLFALFSRLTGVSAGLLYCFAGGARSMGAGVGIILGGLLGVGNIADSNGIIMIAMVCAAQATTVIAFVASTAPLHKITGEQRWKSPISERCAKLAKTYRLTPREEEILVLLAKGRSVDWIQKELYLARGTVAAHTNHIYKKLGIHSKQQLLDMVDNQHPKP